MEITFLVGNGFDLSLGYKTSYKDFYEYYLNQTRDSKDKAISCLRDSIANDLNSGSSLWTDFEVGLGKFTQEFGEDQADNFIDAYLDASQKLHDYLFNLPKLSGPEELTEEQLDTARKNIYHFYQAGTQQEQIDFSNLIGNDKANGNEISFKFVSFNYTNFLDEYIASLAQKPIETWDFRSEIKKCVIKPKVFHVHGLLNDYPILGLSSEDQILNPAFQNNEDIRAALIKTNIESSIGYRSCSTLKGLINKSRIVCLWGLSLGDSDKHWWNFIVNWLHEDPNRIIVIFKHGVPPPSNILPFDRRRKTMNVTSLLLKHSELLKHSAISDMEKIFLIQRIHVIFTPETLFEFPLKDK